MTATVRRTLDTAEPARHALLGLLLDGPRHGYDLTRSFAPGTPLGAVMRLGDSNLYAQLTRLERDGLIVGEVRESGVRPPRRVYHLTEAGREAALRWIDEPVARPRDILLDFPLKLYLARHVGPDRAAALVARQRAFIATYLARLEEVVARLEEDIPDAEKGADTAFIALVREGRIARTRAILAWLDRCAVS